MSALDSPRVLFRAAYYHEYHRTPRLTEDLDLMAQAGFSLIRVGESVWSTWEPEDGRFELDWLRPVLDGAAEHDIKVILGHRPTPFPHGWRVAIPRSLLRVRTAGRCPGAPARRSTSPTQPSAGTPSGW